MVKKKEIVRKERPPHKYGEKVIYHIPEAADVLRVSEAVIRSAIKRKLLHASKIAGRWKIVSEDLDKYLIRMRKYINTKEG